MFDLTFLPDIAIPAIGLIASVVLVRRLAGDQPVDLAVLFGRAGPMPWPRGVQEEEPQPWRFERPRPAPSPARPLVACEPDRPAWAAGRSFGRAGAPTV